jgi:hypothetical protein
MAIITEDNLIAAIKANLTLKKTGGRTTVANSPFSMWDVAGSPGAGTLAGTSTTAGVVPTQATAGAPAIPAVSGASYYLAGIDFGNTVACRMRLYDMLWKGGAYAFGAATSGNTPASYSARVPNGTDFTNLEIWVEQVTAATGNQAVSVTYNNESGTTGRSTGAVGIGAAPTVGRMWQLPLQAGDKGVQGITGVTGSVASAGTFNVLVLRPLWTGRVRMANDGDVHGIDKTLLPPIYADTCLFLQLTTDSTSAGVPDMEIALAIG